VVAEGLAAFRLMSQAKPRETDSMTHFTDTADTGITIIPTGVKYTSAAHMVAEGEPVTVVWSTIPVACTDWVLGDVASQGPVHYPADRVPRVWNSGGSSYPIWHALTEVQCGTCGAMVGPWALVRDGHIEGDELTDAAHQVAEEAEDEREWQRAKLVASLTADARDTVRQLADGDLTRDELPDVGAMFEPGVGLDGDEVVAWGFLPDPAGGCDDEIVEVSRPIPTDQTS